MTQRKFINLGGHLWVLVFYLRLSVVCGHFRNFGISDWLTHLHHWNPRYFWNDRTLWSRTPNTLVWSLHLELTSESQEFLQKDRKGIFCKGSRKIQSGFCWSVLGLAEFRAFSGLFQGFMQSGEILSRMCVDCVYWEYLSGLWTCYYGTQTEMEPRWNERLFRLVLWCRSQKASESLPWTSPVWWKVSCQQYTIFESTLQNCRLHKKDRES